MSQRAIRCRICPKELRIVVFVPKSATQSYRICAKALLIVISVPKRYSLSYLCQSVTHCHICAKALLIVVVVPKRYSLSYLLLRRLRPEFPKRDNELLIEHKISGIFASVLHCVSMTQ